MSGPTESSSAQSPAARISNLVAQLMHTYIGRGPTKTWTTIDNNLVSVVLHDTLTRAEQSLIADGREQFVRDMRKSFQQTMRKDLVDSVESVTGRKVIAFLSDNHIDPDIAIESFVLDSPDGANSKAPAS